MAVRIRGWHLTDVGRVRELNEDSGYADPRGRFFICSDGMGGHAAGDVASQMAVWEIGSRLDVWPSEFDAFAATHAHTEQREALSVIEIAMRMANAIIHERGQAEVEKRGMGCTADVVVIAGDHALCGHVGDSRVYLIRGGDIQQLTVDHSQAPPSAPGEPPAKGRLTSALGPRAACRVDTFAVPLLPDDRILMCTDGLADYFPDARELASVLRARGDEVGPAALIELAKERGGADNITVLMLRVEPGLIDLPLPLPVPTLAWQLAPDQAPQPIAFAPGLAPILEAVPEVAAARAVAALSTPVTTKAAMPTPEPVSEPEPAEDIEFVSPDGRKRMAVLTGSPLFQGIAPAAIAQLLAGLAEVVLPRQQPAPLTLDGEDVAWLILDGARNGHVVYPDALLGRKPAKVQPFSPFSNVAALPLTQARFDAYCDGHPEHSARLVINVEHLIESEHSRLRPTPKK